jgi:general secretion pathway protein G
LRIPGNKHPALSDGPVYPCELTPGANKVLRRCTLVGKGEEMIKKDYKGFTLIELMLVVIIIGALVAMVMPRLTGRSEQARVGAATADVRANIATGLKLYELDNGNFPSTSEGLNALLVKPSGATNWKGPYIEKNPIDPWGREYKYKCPGEHRPADYDLYSVGKDGVESADDAKNWE